MKQTLAAAALLITIPMFASEVAVKVELRRSTLRRARTAPKNVRAWQSPPLIDVCNVRACVTLGAEPRLIEHETDTRRRRAAYRHPDVCLRGRRQGRAQRLPARRREARRR